jgi:Zn-dependent protease with chaperone function
MGSSWVREHAIRLADLNFGWLVLYAFTWGLQWFTWVFRFLAALLVLIIVNAILGWGLPVGLLAFLIGLGPLAISALTLVLPAGSWWFEQRMGGRTPSERERAVFDAALEELRGADPEIRGPARWFVLDDPDPGACAYAHTLMITRGLLDNPCLPAVLAHELGHLNTSDGRVTAALYRIITWPREPLEKPFKLIGFLISGRVGFWPMQFPWAFYWRHREDVADAYAKRLGQSASLAAYLEVYALEGDLPSPFKAFGRTSHPWTEHRIEKLEAS